MSKLFSNDKEMLKFAIEQLQEKQAELDDIICTETPTINLEEVKAANDGNNQTLKFQFPSVAQANKFG